MTARILARTILRISAMITEVDEKKDLQVYQAEEVKSDDENKSKGENESE
ncbi:14041_t:CDS:2, partial [Cetraspora pellucida]